MNEQLMFHEVRELCKMTGLGIDKIAHDCNINQKLVAKMYMATMQMILDNIEKDLKSAESEG